MQDGPPLAWNPARRKPRAVWTRGFAGPPNPSAGQPVLSVASRPVPASRRAGRVWIPPLPGAAAAATPSGLPAPLLVRRRGDDRARRQRGQAIRFVQVGQLPQGQVEYHVYLNTGVGDPINYGSPAATVTATTWTSGGLAAPGDWKLGVRAFWSGSGLEEQNLDCAVEILLDAFGNDITQRPAPPTGLRAFATAGGGITVEWYYPLTSAPPNAARAGRGVPVGFHVYVGTGGTPNYAVPAATVPYSSGFASTFQASLSGLASGTAYTIGVRAYNASAEEPNTITVTVAADAAGPAPVAGLTAIAIV